MPDSRSRRRAVPAADLLDAEGAAVRVDLLRHVEELTRRLLSREAFDGFDEAHRGWLRNRYLEIVPVVLPDALRCVGSGAHLGASSYACVRASAVALRRDDVPFHVALRGGAPALRAFGAFVQTLHQELTFRQTAVLMGRAAIVAQELGASWVEGCRALGVDLTVDGSNLEVATLTTPLEGDEHELALEMVALAATGRSTEQIATATAYSTQAVKWHLGRLMRAWKVGNRSALVAVAFVRGVLVGTEPRPSRQDQPGPPAARLDATARTRGVLEPASAKTRQDRIG